MSLLILLLTYYYHCLFVTIEVAMETVEEYHVQGEEIYNGGDG